MLGLQTEYCAATLLHAAEPHAASGMQDDTLQAVWLWCAESAGELKAHLVTDGGEEAADSLPLTPQAVLQLEQLWAALERVLQPGRCWRMCYSL